MTTETTQLASISIAKLFEDAASTAPIPGGGCVSAIGGYLGVALLLKAIRISARKQLEEKLYLEAEQRLLNLAPQFLECAQRDSDSFQLFISALQRPKSSSEEMASRAKAIQDASCMATRVAIDILDLGNSVLQAALSVRAKVLPTIVSDLKACVSFIRAMSLVSVENAQANLVSIPDKELLKPLNIRLEESLKVHERLLAALSSPTASV